MDWEGKLDRKRDLPQWLRDCTRNAIAELNFAFGIRGFRLRSLRNWRWREAGLET